MASDLERRAREAFVDDNFELALDLYSQAIEVDSTSAALFVERAQTNIKLRNFTDAVADADKAIELDPSMSKAYLRKGTACMKLGEYQTAKAALEMGLSLAPGDSRFTHLIKECDENITEEENHKQKNTSVNSYGISTTGNLEPEPIVEPPKPKYRYDFYNTPTEAVVTIFAKGVPAEYVRVDFGEQILSISIDIPGEESYYFQPRLFAKIIPEKCKFQVLSTKIEVRLAKAESIGWPSLEYCSTKPLPQNITQAMKPYKPSYPSSKAKVDWDKLEAQVKKEEKDEKLDGDAALNKLFRDIYGDGDEDMRRAMMKSFVESNGTVLSTSWKDVGSKKVEGTPPDGMELKKWEY
ncbi:hypothetical protein LUZ63_019386 [Rhynchospora breviuscula]|uniref:Protein SGT1 homolog n=1 Tax=Rhynchospora breviuscula TaxID=2022672 RepID=A0A9Q0C628_9POAL|nr:hypothetical protein LUZ63_019386 [Rhynchospora breviuscula]